MVTRHPSAEKWVIGPTPLRPAQMAAQLDGTSAPHGLTAPNPVMTTRFTGAQLCVMM
jgi:hypothetical protein